MCFLWSVFLCVCRSLFLTLFALVGPGWQSSSRAVAASLSERSGEEVGGQVEAVIYVTKRKRKKKEIMSLVSFACLLYHGIPTHHSRPHPTSLFVQQPTRHQNLHIGTRFLITRLYSSRFQFHVISLFFHSISMTIYSFTSSVSSSRHPSGLFNIHGILG